jgi:hypothetical protein
MSETIEQAKEGIEHAHHASEGGHGDKSPRNVAILIAALAAALALAEMGEKAAQNSYLTHHISVSDSWGFFQARNIRATTYASSADIIESLPNLDAEGKARAAKLRAEAARMRDDPVGGDGSKQISAKAQHDTEARDHAFHVYHQFELATGALQIAIVLASVSIVTRLRPLTLAAAAIGGTAALFAALVAGGVV